MSSSYTNLTSVTASGSDQSSAAVFSDHNIDVNAGSGGVILPTPGNADSYRITNSLLASLNVYPPSGIWIGSLNTNEPISLPSLSTGVFVTPDGTYWLMFVE